MNFLVDAQLPPALARWIEGTGHPARHVFDIGLQAADDAVLWEQARNDQSIIVSKDEDFVDCWILSNQPVLLIWIRKGNCSNRELLAWPASLWPEAVRRLESGEQFIELRA